MKMKEMKLLAILTVMVMAFAAFATISDSSEDEGDVSYEAKIGSTYYETFTEAIWSATSGQTVEILKNCDYSKEGVLRPILTQADDVTVKGNNYTLTIKISNVDLRDGTVFNNVKFHGSFTGTENMFNVYGDGEGVSLTGSKDLTFNKCSFTGDGCVDNYIQFGNTNLASGKLFVTDCTFDNTNCKNRDIRVAFIDTATTAESHITVTGCTLTAFDPQAEDKNIPVKISGKTDAGFYTMAGNKMAGKNLNVYNVKDAVVLAQESYFAAKIGTVYYETLADAIADVGSGETIYVLKDVEKANGISVPSGKNFIVDFQNHTYLTEKPGAGSPNTTTMAFQLLKDSTITFKNGTIGCTADNKDITWAAEDKIKGVARIIQNYSNLTLENMTIDATNIAHNGDNVRIAVSNNCGNTSIKNTHIITVAGDIAFDSYKGGDYSKPTVAVSKSSVIDGKIQLSGGDVSIWSGVKVNGQVSVGENKDGGSTGSTFNLDLDATVSADGYAIVVFGDNTAKISGTVNGSVATGGNSADSEILVLAGSKITAPKGYAAIFIPNGKLEVGAGVGEITGETAIYVKSGQTSILGGTMTGTLTPADHEYIENGMSPTGDALVIDACGDSKGTFAVLIDGGTFNAKKNAIGYYHGENSAVIQVNDGTFSDLSGLQYTVKGAEYVLGKDCIVTEDVEVKSGVNLKVSEGKALILKDNTEPYIKLELKSEASFTGKITYQAADTNSAVFDGLKAAEGETVTISHGSIAISGKIDASLTVSIAANGQVKLNDVIIEGTTGSLIITETSSGSVSISDLTIEAGATLEIMKDTTSVGDIEMKAGSNLVVCEDATLTINKDVTLDNNGEVTVKSSGKIVNEGTVCSSDSTGKIINQGTIENKGDGVITPSVEVANHHTITVVPNYEIRGTATADKTEAREGETIALHATPAAGYLFSEWKCVGIASVGPDNTFIMPATAVTITAVFVEDTRHIITVEKVGEGQATASIDKELKGQTVTLAAVPEDGYVFSTWQSSDVTITNPTSEIASFVMPDKAVTIKAVFAKLYTITVTSDGHGTAKAVGGITQAIAGKKIALSTTADDGYGFKDWQSSDVTVGSDNTFTMPEKNVTVKATFDKVYNINITTDGNGTVTASPEKQVAGKTVKLTDRPKSGYYLSELKVDGQTITTGSFVMPAADVSVTASFEPYAAIIKVVENGSVTLSAALTEYLRITDESKLVLTIDYIPNPSQPNIPKDALAFNISLTYDGRSVTKFVPNIYVTLNYEAAAGEVIDGYDVYYVSANGGVVEDMNAVYQDDAFAFSASHFSTFVISPTVIEPVIFKHPITVLTDGSGTASANKVQAAVNEVVTVTAVPADGYAFAGWISEDVDFMDATKNQTTFLMMDNSVTVTAMFIDKYDITVKIEGKGTASAIPSKALAGETVRLTATSESGYYFSEWKSETEGVKIVNGQFVMPESDVTVKAVFVAYTDVTKSTANGSVTIPAALAEKYGMKDSTGLILTISKISKPAQSNIPKDALAYDISLTYNGKELTSFAQKIEIKINYDIASGQSIVGWDVYYVSDDGKTVEDMNSTYKNKGFVFETDHLSTYVISPTVIEPVKEAQDHSLLMIIVAIIAAIVVVAAVLLIVWKKNQTI